MNVINAVLTMHYSGCKLVEFERCNIVFKWWAGGPSSHFCQALPPSTPASTFICKIETRCAWSDRRGLSPLGRVQPHPQPKRLQLHPNVQKVLSMQSVGRIRNELGRIGLERNELRRVGSERD